MVQLHRAEKSAKSGQNGLCALPSIFKMAQGFFLFFTILNHLNIPITNCEVGICCTFFPSELPLPTWVYQIAFVLPISESLRNKKQTQFFSSSEMRIPSGFLFRTRNSKRTGNIVDI